jgi:molecular chaperone GrpE
MQDQENQEVIPPSEETISTSAPGENSLEAQLSATEAKLAEMHDAFMRAKAEGENIRRRAQEDVSKAHKFAIESFAEAMVPVRDSLEMALKIEAPTLDPMKHQAVAVVPAEQEANTVVTVLQKGYMIADRLLRPAIVTAAQAK